MLRSRVPATMWQGIFDSIMELARVRLEFCEFGEVQCSPEPENIRCLGL
jgi:hypothetical protein